MHITAYQSCKKFVEKYAPTGRVLDVGSMDVNGTLKPIFPHMVYIGLDIAQGDNVDVIYDGKKFPFADKSFDCVVSSSCLEHDPAFWRTFAEMVRVCRGFIYLNVPSAQSYHPYPVDCWRFLADAMPALADSVPGVELLETYIDAVKPWGDNVGIFRCNTR